MSEIKPVEIDIYGMMVQCRTQVVNLHLSYQEIERNMTEDGVDRKTAKKVIAATKKMVRDKELSDKVTYYTTMMARYMVIYEKAMAGGEFGPDSGSAIKALNEHRKCHFLLSQLID